MSKPENPDEDEHNTEDTAEYLPHGRVHGTAPSDEVVDAGHWHMHQEDRYNHLYGERDEWVTTTEEHTENNVFLFFLIFYSLLQIYINTISCFSHNLT